MTGPRIHRRHFAIAGALLFTAGSAMAQANRSTAPGTGGVMPLNAAFQPLVHDHTMVDQVFSRIANSTSPDEQRRLFLQVKAMLDAHALAEENVIYPALARIADSADDARDLYRDHAVMKVALFELDAIPMSDARWKSGVANLARRIKAHAHEEEQEDFLRLQRALDERQMAELGRMVQREKGRLT
jgi:hemerythrin superfamily protein